MKLSCENSLYGKTKNILGKDEQGYIYKQFKKDQEGLSFLDQQKIIATKMRYFGEYIPETDLQEIEDGSYIIKQKFIDGRHLKDIDIKNLGIIKVLCG